MKSEKKVSSNVQKNELGSLVSDSHEKLAINFIEDSLNGNARTFSVADMWSLHKKQRSALEMRRWLN